MFILKKTHTEHVNALQSTITHLRADASKNIAEIKALTNDLRHALNEVEELKFKLANAKATTKCHEQAFEGIKKLLDLTTRGATKVDLDDMNQIYTEIHHDH